MRIGIVIVVLLTSTAQLFSASPVKSQSIDKVDINLNLANESLAGAFLKIQSQTPFYFMYRNEDIQAIRNINYSAKNKSVAYVLKSLLNNTSLSFKQVDARILIISKNPDKKETSGLPTYSTDRNMTLLAADTLVNGVITDLKGETLPGVLVKVKGTTLATATDAAGNFRIRVTGNNPVLTISYVGYVTQEIPVSGRSTINVKLEESQTALNEVVVVGYGTVRRSDLVSSVSSVSTKDIKNQPAARVDEVLQGRSAGLNIQNNSAAPNGAITIRIRGSNSLAGTNDPLVVIDGFIGGDLASVNPNDIASIEVLKDASATAIYGSRGSNGVILVSTKLGTTSKTTVQYNTYLNFQSINKKMDLLNAAEYAETVNANRADLGLAQPFTAAQISDFRLNGGTDWQDQVFKKALQQSHQISIAGGGERSTYFLSGNFTNNDGIMKGSSFRRYSLRSNVESKINKNLKAGVNVFLTKTEDHPAVTRGNQDSSPTQAALLWSPTLPVYNADGTYTRPSSSFGPPAVNNPLALAIEPIRDNMGYRGELNTFLNYDIIPGLSARVQFGARMVDDENSVYLNTKPQGNLGNAVASITNSRFTELQNTNQLTYTKKFAKVHDITATAVYEQQVQVVNSSFAGSNGFSTDLLTYNNLSLGSIPQIPTSTRTRKDIQSVLGRLNYSFMDKYLLSIAGRYDGASVFGENNKWGFFPSGALAWRVTGEEFMKNLTYVSNLKLRTSYGVTGSQALGPYSSLSTLNTNNPYPISSNALATGVGLGTLGNPDLKWEKTYQFNAGFDLGLFNERITLTADYYNKQTRDLLMNVPLPRTSGYTTIIRNIGEVQNRGFEIGLGGSPVTGTFAWNTNLNFSVNKNKVLALSGSNEVAMGNTGFPNFGNTIFLQVGQPIGVLKGYIQDGIWSTAEQAQAATFGSIPGAPKYRDVNGDNVINGSDITFMGNTLPKYTYGWSNTFSYKSFDLNVLLQGSQGNKVYNQTRIRSERSSSDADATDRRILNRWSQSNQNTDVPSFLGSNRYEQVQSSRWMEDGSYLRFKNITLGYSLPKAVLSKVKVVSARLFVSGVNLITFTKYTGYDPEASTNVGTLGGIDQAPYPSQKMYTAGLNVTF